MARSRAARLKKAKRYGIIRIAVEERPIAEPVPLGNEIDRYVAAGQGCFQNSRRNRADPHRHVQGERVGMNALAGPSGRPFRSADRRA